MNDILNHVDLISLALLIVFAVSASMAFWRLTENGTTAARRQARRRRRREARRNRAMRRQRDHADEIISGDNRE